jgi:hypothetical protein
MLPLRDLQRAFFASLTGYSPDGPASMWLREIRGDSRLDAAARVAVYERMYRTRLIEAVANDHPRLVTTLGWERFAEIAGRYVDMHPSVHASLRWFGAQFASHVTAMRDPRDPPFAADLARLEWARLEVFDAREVAVLTMDELRRLPAEAWGALVLRPIGALATLRAEWPVHRIWEAAEHAAPSSAWPRERTWLRVWRQGDRVFQAPMDGVERAALAHVRHGDDLAGLCQVLAPRVAAEDAPTTAAALLLRWIEDGILAAPMH